MKGILMAGGSGTRLNPITEGISKQLIQIYDKPMVYYSLSTLMLAKIQDINIVCQSFHVDHYQKLLGDGSDFGINLTYSIQNEPKGIADGILISKDFIGKSECALMLGDNFFWGQGFSTNLTNAKNNKGASIFSVQVKNPSDYGIVEFDKAGRVISIEEKPKQPCSNYAVTGLYFYDNSVVDRAQDISPSDRGELEITDVNSSYLMENKLSTEILGRGFAWLDTGTIEGIYEASSFVRSIQSQQGYQIANLEEIAFRNNWLTKNDLDNILSKKSESEYYNYLREIIE